MGTAVQILGALLILVAFVAAQWRLLRPDAIGIVSLGGLVQARRGGRARH